jgi:signal transduction histidine kinase
LELSQIKNKELMNVIAHDMRNPIASIVSISDFLLNDDTMLENEKRKFLEMQLKAGNDALRYMSDILNERNNVFFDSKKLTEIQKVLHNCADMCSVLALEKNIKINLDAEEQILKLDEDKIWSVINNLISNAIKFSNANTNIEITGKVVNESYRISVKDSGIGIPNELKDKIFLQDERVKREGTNGEVSYGLGLSIAKHIIQSHNGKIWFESEEGKGTTFFIELPI